AAPHPAGAGPVLDAIRRAGHLRAAVDLSSPPMAFRDASGPRGFDIDLVTMVAQGLDVRADITDMPVAAMHEAFPRRADLAAGALSGGIVPGIATEPYTDVAPVIVWGAKTPGSAAADLRGKRVVAAAGSPGEQLARGAGAVVVTTYLPEQSLAMVAEGRVQAAVAGGPEAMGFVWGRTGLRTSVASGPDVPLVLVVRPGADDLAVYVSDVVRELRANGGLDQLRRRWHL
ncbi:MAG TPA: transporter substrate-binding domain-containing protein, partial [bacterium]|nr:transporter substrate-binding domain-containing protein [bacterium]